MTTYDMKCKICGAKVGEQAFAEDNIPSDDPRLIGPAVCASHDPDFPPSSGVPWFTPSHGPVGTAVTILVYGMADAVKFNEVAAANPRIVSGKLVVDVPSGASTGQLSVTPSGHSECFLGSFTVE